MSQSRQLAAIMFTDIVGYTALMGDNEQKAFELLNKNRLLQKPIIEKYKGRWIKELGDGILASFNTVSDAVNAAIKIQEGCNQTKEFQLRIGIHQGEIIFENNDIYGDAVNIASRIQSLGVPGSVLFSQKVNDELKNKSEFQSISLGNFDFKNIDTPIEVFALANVGFTVPAREQMSGKLKYDHSKKKKIDTKKTMIAALLLILVIASIFLYSKYFREPNRNIEKSIAIIPFRNMSNDSQQEYFAEGMMDEILNHLYKVGGLNVISRTSSMAYNDSKKTSKEIANELGVGNLLEGSVQKEGDHIRIIVQLINGKTDQHLWAETYDREFKDIFSIQSDIAQQIAAALKVKIDPDTKSRIEHTPTENTSAYNLYLLSKEKFSNNDGKSWKELLEKVIRLDSSFAPAYADLAFYWLGADVNAKQVLDSALPLLKKAMYLDTNLSSVHAYMAYAYYWYQWDFKSAESEWKKFFQLNPSGFWWVDYVDFLIADSRSSEALDFALKEFNRNKRDVINWTSLAFSYYYTGQPDKALAILDSASLIFKDPNVFNMKARVFIHLGKYQQVIDNLNKEFAMEPNDREATRMQAWLAISYFHTGRLDESRKIVDSLQFLSKKSPAGSSPAFHVAMIYTMTGRTEIAFQWLEKAFINHEVEMHWLKADRLFATLHNDPKFRELLNKMGFK
jgi:adenylate cyclase